MAESAPVEVSFPYFVERAAPVYYHFVRIRQAAHKVETKQFRVPWMMRLGRSEHKRQEDALGVQARGKQIDDLQDHEQEPEVQRCQLPRKKGLHIWYLGPTLFVSVTPRGQSAGHLSCGFREMAISFRTDVDHDSEVMPISVPN